MLRRCTLTVVAALLTTLAAARPATAQSSIDLYFDAEYQDCDATLTAPTQFTVYVVARLGDDAPDEGIAGAEFRVDGFAPTWMTTATPNPLANAVQGNPTQGGVNMAFLQCQGVAPIRDVLLYTIGSIAIDPIPPTTLQVLMHSNPSNANFQCPSLVICTPPVFGRFCVDGLTACINTVSSCCIVATAPATWSGVKALYDGTR